MLEGFAKHGFFDLTLSVNGDLHVDAFKFPIPVQRGFLNLRLADLEILFVLLKAYPHRVRMCRQTLFFRKQLNILVCPFKRLSGIRNNARFLHEIIYIERRKKSCRSVCRQNMIRPRIVKYSSSRMRQQSRGMWRPTCSLRRSMMNWRARF